MLQFRVAYPRIPTKDSADQMLTWLVMQILKEHNDLTSNRSYLTPHTALLLQQ
ncbi:MAG: hypothetical protein LQ351_004726 [Letrouitia transgressa]|nr:MAG: hypothetical protein LQ351_004726 [Letrouitia transgressa]